MAPIILAAAAVFFILQSVTADPTGVTVFNVSPNVVSNGVGTATLTGQLTFTGSGVTGGNQIACSSDTGNTYPTSGQAIVGGTTTTSATQSDPANFTVTIGTTYTVTTGANIGTTASVDPNLYEITCRAAGPGGTAANGVRSTTSANLAVNPQTQPNNNPPYFLTSSIDKSSVTSQAGTSSVATISGTYTKPATPAFIVCQRVGPPGNTQSAAPTYTYTVNSVPGTNALTTTTTGTYSVAVNFNGVSGGINTIRCALRDTNSATGGFEYGAAAYSVMVMPPQVVRFGPLAVDLITIPLPAPSATTGARAGFKVSGSVQYADNTTAARDIFCTSTTSGSAGLPILIGQGATTTLSTATRQDVDFSVIVGDINSVAPSDTGFSTTTGATCDNSAGATGSSCVFKVGNQAVTATGAAAYTTAINDYGIQCYSGKIVTNDGTQATTRAILVDSTTLASLRSNPTSVAVPTADVGVTKPNDATGATPTENFVATTSTTTAPTVSSTNATANSLIQISGQTQAIGSSARTVTCKTGFSSPAQFSASNNIVVANGPNQAYSVSLPVPANATSGLYTFRCLLNPATAGNGFVAVTDPSVNVTILGIAVTPTSSPTAPTAPTPTRPTLPTASPSAGPTAPTPPTRTPPRPNPTPFPTKPRTPGPVPFTCSKDDEYRAPGGCRRCVSSESPFKQVFGGSVCVNPTTFSSKSTTCSTYTLQAFPRKDGSNDKTAGCISQKSQTISLLLVASPQSEVDFLSSASYRKTSLRLGTLRARSNRGLVIWVKKGKRQLVQFDDRYRTVRKLKGKSVKLTGTLRPYVGATLLRCFTAYIKVCDD